MSRESRRNESDALEPEELSVLLAEATDTTAEEIEAGAEEFEIASPSEATVVEE